MENITKVNISELHPFPNHPFQVRDDDAMKETVESVREYGVLSPVIVRPREEGEYEIISGHRRTRACKIAVIEEIPVIIRNMDNEKAAAYKMKADAMKRKELPLYISNIDSMLEKEKMINNEKKKKHEHRG